MNSLIKYLYIFELSPFEFVYCAYYSYFRLHTIRSLLINSSIYSVGRKRLENRRFHPWISFPFSEHFIPYLCQTLTLYHLQKKIKNTCQLYLIIIISVGKHQPHSLTQSSTFFRHFVTHKKGNFFFCMLKM